MNVHAAITAVQTVIASKEKAEQQLQAAKTAVAQATAQLREQLAQLSIEGVIDLLPPEDRPELIHLDYPQRKLAMLKDRGDSVAYILDLEDRKAVGNGYVNSTGVAVAVKVTSEVYIPCYELVPWFPTWLPEQREEEVGGRYWYKGEEEYWRIVKDAFKRLGVRTLFVPGHYYARQYKAQARFGELTCEIVGNTVTWDIEFKDVRHYNGDFDSRPQLQLFKYMSFGHLTRYW